MLQALPAEPTSPKYQDSVSVFYNKTFQVASVVSGISCENHMTFTHYVHEAVLLYQIENHCIQLKEGRIVCSFGQTVCGNVADKFPGENNVTL